MIDLNKPDSTEQEQPSEKTDVEILKAKLQKVKRKLRNKDKYIHNLKQSYSERVSILKAEIKFDNIMLIGFAIFLAIVTFRNDSDHKNEKVIDSSEVIHIQKSVPEKNTNTGDKVVSSNSQNLLQVAVEKSPYITTDDIQERFILKAMELDNLSDRSELVNQNSNHEVLSYISNLFERQLEN